MNNNTLFEISDALRTASVCLHAKQLEVFSSPARFRVLVAGRRFGKSELALAEILRAAVSQPNQLCWYVGPEKAQAADVAWFRLKEVTERFWAKRPSETDQSIRLFNDSTIILKSAFNYDSLRGRGINFLVLDEFALIKPEAWQKVFRPALADRQGNALLMSTPKGRNHVFDFFEFAQSHPDWACFQFSTEQGGIVSPEELQSAGGELDTQSFRQEFLAEFGSPGLYRVYQSFDRAINVKDVRFDHNFPLVWSLDFNVDPMIMLIMQKIGEVVHVLEEMVVRPNANTRKACEAFITRTQNYYLRPPFDQHPLVVRIFGDASGNQRRTAGTETDWAIVHDVFSRYKGVYEPHFCNASSNPLVRDRVNCVNARLQNHWQEVNLFVNPSCKELIRDLEEVSWQTDATGRPTNELDKADRNRTHASDALGYFISEVFPFKPKVGFKDKRLIF